MVVITLSSKVSSDLEREISAPVSSILVMRADRLRSSQIMTTIQAVVDPDSERGLSRVTTPSTPLSPPTKQPATPPVAGN